MSVLGKVVLDVVNPFLVPSVLLFEVIVVIIEAAVIYFLLERSVRTALLASFTANLISGILSIFYFLFPMGTVSALASRLGLMLAVGLVVNVLVETGVLKALFFKSTDFRKLFKASTIMNLASYAILILYFA